MHNTYCHDCNFGESLFYSMAEAESPMTGAFSHVLVVPPSGLMVLQQINCGSDVNGAADVFQSDFE